MRHGDMLSDILTIYAGVRGFAYNKFFRCKPRRVERVNFWVQTYSKQFFVSIVESINVMNAAISFMCKARPSNYRRYGTILFDCVHKFVYKYLNKTHSQESLKIGSFLHFNGDHNNYYYLEQFCYKNNKSHIT